MQFSSFTFPPVKGGSEDSTAKIFGDYNLSCIFKAFPPVFNAIFPLCPFPRRQPPPPENFFGVYIPKRCIFMPFLLFLMQFSSLFLYICKTCAYYFIRNAFLVLRIRKIGIRYLKNCTGIYIVHFDHSPPPHLRFIFPPTN